MIAVVMYYSIVKAYLDPSAIFCVKKSSQITRLHRLLHVSPYFRMVYFSAKQCVLDLVQGCKGASRMMR